MCLYKFLVFKFQFSFAHTVSPSITALPQITAAPVGATATLTCGAVGIPSPMVMWYQGEEQVGSDRVLLVEDVDEDSSGMYTCRASNDAGDTAMSAELAVYGKWILEV